MWGLAVRCTAAALCVLVVMQLKVWDFIWRCFVFQTMETDPHFLLLKTAQAGLVLAVPLGLRNSAASLPSSWLEQFFPSQK